MQEDYSCGVIPYRVTDGRREFLLIQHHAGHWAFPKGHPEGDESPFETAQRELREETGLDGAQAQPAPAFEESYVFAKPSGKQVHKRVTYYLCEVDAQAAVQMQPEEIADHAWGDEAATRQRLTFDEGRSLFDQVLAYL